MATGAPGTNGVWQYGEDDSEATFSALLNKAASTTDSVIGTAKGRITVLEAKPLAGLVPIVPTAVTFVGGTGSVTSTGAMNFSTCSSIIADGIFTSEYKNYLLIISGQRPTAASGYIYLRLRTGSPAADVSTNYSGGLTAFYYGGGGCSAFGASSNTDGLISRTYYDKFASVCSIFQPQQAIGTKFSGTAHGSDAANGTYMVHGAEHNANTQFTGATIFSSGSLATGQAQFYGYND